MGVSPIPYSLKGAKPRPMGKVSKLPEKAQIIVYVDSVEYRRTVKRLCDAAC